MIGSAPPPGADGGSYEDFRELVVTQPYQHVFHVEFNRPTKRNSLNYALWREIGRCFERLAEEPECRVVVVSGRGKCFCAGFDFEGMKSLATSNQDTSTDIARDGWMIRKNCLQNQRDFNNIENCPKPVITAVHGACYGAAVGINSVADIRFATFDAFFCIKEVDVGLVEDVGTVPRLPKKTGNDSFLREFALTSATFTAREAALMGMVSRLFHSKEDMMRGAFELAQLIASKSPVAVQGTKHCLNYSRDHSVDDSLLYITAWNMSQIQSEDVTKSALATAARKKDPPVFSRL